MCQLTGLKEEQGTSMWLIRHCNDLFREWLEDLSAEEKEAWLWNASIEMLRIKRRRGIQRV